MARTNSDAVKAVLAGGKDYDLALSPSLSPYIDAAYSLVNRVVVCAAKKNIVISDEDLELIERWLAAHFYAVSDKPYSSRSTLGASGSFQGQTAMHLDATLYGQQAKLIDYSGCLENISNKQRVRVGWLGKRPSEQMDYSDRD